MGCANRYFSSRASTSAKKTQFEVVSVISKDINYTMSLVPEVWEGPWWINVVTATEKHLRATFDPCSCGDRHTMVRYGGKRTIEEAKELLIEKVCFYCAFRELSCSIQCVVCNHYFAAPSARGWSSVQQDTNKPFDWNSTRRRPCGYEGAFRLRLIPTVIRSFSFRAYSSS